MFDPAKTETVVVSIKVPGLPTSVGDIPSWRIRGMPSRVHKTYSNNKK